MNTTTLNKEEISGTACIITGGLLDTIHAKTTHGLLRESNRFEILGIIDAKFAGQDISQFVGGTSARVEIFSTISELEEKLGRKPKYAVIGMATKGGLLPQSLYAIVLEALSHGLHIVNGLHQPLANIEEILQMALKNNAQIYDIRKPKPFDQLHFWNGKIREVNCLKIGVLGTDCSTGKRTTTRLLVNLLNKQGIKTEMIYTGQTGWMQGTKYGFIFDATPNDFIPGEIEHAIVECWEQEKPQIIIVEGQASLLNPGGPCGSEFIISGKLDAVILQHHPIREKYNNLELLPEKIPNPEIDIKMISMMGSEVIAITINTKNMNEKQIQDHGKLLKSQTGLPVFNPLTTGISELAELVKSKLEQ